MAALLLAAAGCAPAGTTNVGQPPFMSPVSSATDRMPLRYTLRIMNALAGPTTVTLTPGRRTTLAGPASFALAAHNTATENLRISDFSPGPIVDVDIANGDRSQRLHDVVSIVDSAVALRMRGVVGMDEDAGIRRNNENTAVTVTIAAKPAARASVAGTEYSVTVANALPNDPLDVSVKASENSVLQGPPSFALAPDTSRTVRVTDTGSFSASDIINIVDAKTKDLSAKLELIKDKGDQVSITKMFEMQLLMNKFSQLSEMTTSIVSATNSAISSMARNVKS